MTHWRCRVFFIFLLGFHAVLRAADPVVMPSNGGESSEFFHLDPRSAYGQDAFPEPFLVDDSDWEDDEFRVDTFHTQGHAQQSDSTKAEVEKGFGPLTLEIETPYVRNKDAGQVSEGLSNIDLGARIPVYQSVSKDGGLDSTFGTAFEVGVPTNSIVSKNTEVVPKVFNDLKMGDRFTLQTVLGYSALLGGGEEGGSRSFEYGFVLGCTFQRNELSWPDVEQFTPIFELSGQTALNKSDSGHSSILGDLGFRLNLKAIRSVQPRHPQHCPTGIRDKRRARLLIHRQEPAVHYPTRC
jgi:hypothetical protein